MVPYFEGRVGYGLDQFGARTADEDYEGLPQVDAEAAVRLLQDVLGGHRSVREPRRDRMRTEILRRPDQVVFASDAPFDPEGGPLYIRETIRVIDSLEIIRRPTPEDLPGKRRTPVQPRVLIVFRPS